MISLSDILRRWRRPLAGALGVASLLGAAAAVWMMAAAWEHNPMRTIRDENGADWPYLMGIGLSWFVAVAALAAPPFALVAVALSEARDWIRGRGRRI